MGGQQKKNNTDEQYGKVTGIHVRMWRLHQEVKDMKSNEEMKQGSDADSRLAKLVRLQLEHVASLKQELVTSCAWSWYCYDDDFSN